MQRRPDNFIISSEDCFDMWRDYMDLSGLMLRLCVERDVETQETQGADTIEEPELKRCSRRHLRGWSGRGSAGTSSASSPSDRGCRGTSSSDFCRFCKQNGETPRVFRSHRLKSDEGKVICPILRNFTCNICGATGDSAHTRRYCPQAKQEQAMMKCW